MSKLENNFLATGHELNIDKMLGRRPSRLMYVQFTSCVQGIGCFFFNLRNAISTAFLTEFSSQVVLLGVFIINAVETKTLQRQYLYFYSK